jgi:hypothetical protein
VERKKSEVCFEVYVVRGEGDKAFKSFQGRCATKKDAVAFAKDVSRQAQDGDRVVIAKVTTKAIDTLVVEKVVRLRSESAAPQDSKSPSSVEAGS